MIRPALPFVGRAAELTALRETCLDAGALIVVGASGFGKTRLINELTANELLTCTSATGSPELQTSPYAVFRTLALQWRRLLDPTSLGWADTKLAQLAPIFSGYGGNSPTTAETPVNDDQLWITLLDYLDELAATANGPMVMVIEDLHHVDDPSLRLFGWLAAQPVGLTTLGTALPATPKLLERLPILPLRPLDVPAIEAMLGEMGAAPMSAEALHEVTGGVPAQLNEWIRTNALADSPQGLATVVAELIAGCDRASLDVLRIAALLPEHIDVAVLSRALPLTADEANEALRVGETRDLLVQRSDGRWQFRLDSYAAALLSELDHKQLRTYQRRLLEGLRDDREQHLDMLGSLAHIASSIGDDPGEAARLHLAAGRYTAAIADPHLAEEHFAQARAQAAAAHDQSLALEATLALGLHMAQLATPGTAAVLTDVYALADELDDGDAFAQAALAEPVGRDHVGVSMMTDHVVVARLRGAETRVVDPHLRARVLISLALQQHESLSQHAYFELLAEAEAIAHELDDDDLDDLLLMAQTGARRTLENRSAERDDTERDAVQRALSRFEPFDPRALPMADLAVMLACRSGDLAGAESLLRRYEDEFAPLPTVAQWSMLRARAAIAFARGSLEAARSLALEALHGTTDTRLDVVAIEHFAFQITAMLRERRKLIDARPTVETWVTERPSYAAFRASRAWLLADTGELDSARSDLEVFFAQDLEEVRGRAEGPVSIAMAVSAAAAIGDDSAAQWCHVGHTMLAPIDHEWLLVGPGSLIEGPVVRVMALASAALGDFERALSENEAAQRLAHEAGAQLFSWHALRDRGLILQRAGRHDEAEAALLDAAARYRSAGLLQQADWLEDLAHGDRDRDDAPLARSARGSFRREHRVWHVGLGDEQAICRHLKGMAMIAALLSAPGRPVSAAALAAVGDGEPMTQTQQAIRSESAQQIVDDAAVQAYRRRLDVIVEELDRADRRGDEARSAELTAEFDAITAELATTHGLGGRRRSMTTEDERARVRVNKAIRSAIRRIGEQAPHLADHLARSIDTGLFCSYRPDPIRPVDWNLTTNETD